MKLKTLSSIFLLIVMFHTISFVIFPVTVYAQANGDMVPYVSKKFSDPGLNQISIQNTLGSIQVTGGNSDQFEVELFIRALTYSGKNRWDKKTIENWLKDYDLFIGAEGDKIRVRVERRAEMKDDLRNRLYVSIRVKTPRNVSTDLKMDKGSISIYSVIGTHNVVTRNGTISLHEVEGVVQGHNDKGDIYGVNTRKTMNLVAIDGNISVKGSVGAFDLKTMKGAIRLRKLEGEIIAQANGGGVVGDTISGSIDVGTSDGSVRMAQVVGTLKTNVSGGRTEVAMAQLGKKLELTSVGGDIRVKIPVEDGLDLDLKGYSVSIPLKNFDGRADKDRVNGKMNGGGIPVTISASAGGVYVNQ